MSISIKICVACLIILSTQFLFSQSDDLRLLEWKPKSQLVVKETRILKPKFPVIDIHNHLKNLSRTQEYLEEMDKAGVWKCVGLDGHQKDEFYLKHLQVSQSLSNDRFIIFFRIDWSKLGSPDFGKQQAKKLEKAFKMGIRGLKIHKTLGLGLKDQNGNRIPVDDLRLDPIWAKCGELGIPVLMHVSDPKAFFTPLDLYNERYDELMKHPHYRFYDDQCPSKEQILTERNRVIAKHPNTIFIGAHVGNLAEELHRVAMWFDCYPNFYVDISARISELGRQPYTARRFFIDYQDRILFGTDTNPNADAYRIYYRFLETDDEYFNPTKGHHLQGRWMIYGIHLPDSVLEKIYYQNALRILKNYQLSSPEK